MPTADLGDWEPEGPGPWFEAGFDSEPSCCGIRIEPGDMIRADGGGGWEHKDCILAMATHIPPGKKPSEITCLLCGKMHAGECV